MGTSSGYGVVFKLTPPAVGHTSWTETTLWNFTGGSDGAYPGGNLLFDKDGVLYGTTGQPNTSACGSVFKLAPPDTQHSGWTLSPVWNFTGSDGCAPGGLVADRRGALYGATADGGSANAGVVFKLTGTGFVPSDDSAETQTP